MFEDEVAVERQLRRGRLRSVAASAVLVVAAVLAGLYMVSNLRAEPPEHQRIVTVSSAPWEPYMGPSLPEDGPLAQIIREALGHEGMEVEFDYSAWPLAHRDVASGRSMAVGPVTFTEDRAASGTYSTELATFSYAVYARATDLRDDGALRRPLGEMTVGIVDGYRLWPAIEESGAEFVAFESATAAFRALSAGKVDVAIEGELVADSLIRGKELEIDAAELHRVILPETQRAPVQSLHLYAGDSDSGRRFVGAFDAGLAQLRASERYEELLDALDGRAETVRVRSSGPAPAPLADDSGELIGRTPDGATAMVLTWEGEWERARVKVQDGPLAGRVGWLALEDVEIVGD